MPECRAASERRPANWLYDEYSFTPQGKRAVALDIKQTGVLQGLPLQFSGNNLVMVKTTV
jgi:hypothetical protein